MLKRDQREECEAEVAVKKASRQHEQMIEQIFNYANAGTDKKNNHFSLSTDQLTSTGDVISPNGIRLWGMW